MCFRKADIRSIDPLMLYSDVYPKLLVPSENLRLLFPFLTAITVTSASAAADVAFSIASLFLQAIAFVFDLRNVIEWEFILIVATSQVNDLWIWVCHGQIKTSNKQIYGR